MKEKTCCFTGHRVIPEKDLGMIKRRLKKEIKRLIKQGVDCFACGGALGFDTIAALTVLELKKRYCKIKLILLLPCKNQTKGWKDCDIKVYNEILERADEVTYVSAIYFKGVMFVRNRLLVDRSSFCIAYLTKPIGGAAYTVDYAKSVSANRDIKCIMI